jgi:putative ABC transport system permease protein
MLPYQIKIAIKSLRRNPVLSALLIAGIGLGIAVSTTFVTTHYLLSSNPIPEKSDSLFYVQLDSWNPDAGFDDDDPSEPPNQVTYRDMMALMENDIPTYKTGNFKAEFTVHPESSGGESQRPYREVVRMCFSDFFPMFNVPFEFGGGWGESADRGPEPVIVIDGETNRKLFGGENSVGKSLRIKDREFTIVGVMAPWRPTPKFYDTRNGSIDDPEAIYMPLRFNVPFEASSAGNTNGWKFEASSEYADRLQSERTWIQMWVQLDTPQQKEEYLAFLDAYTMDQRSLGRFQRPTNNRLRNVMEWMIADEAIPEETRTMLIIGILFLVVSSVNLIGILLGKFLSRAPEVGVRRALGASKISVFLQHLVECEILGVLGGVLGLGLSVVALKMINGLFDQREPLFYLDLNMVGAGLVLSLIAGLVAGIYPAWRICRVAPATYLKLQ